MKTFTIIMIIISLSGCARSYEKGNRFLPENRDIEFDSPMYNLDIPVNSYRGLLLQKKLDKWMD